MRNRILIAFSILLCILWSTSCRKDFEYAPSNGNLSFSKDTVYLDTVFASIGSSTYTLKVFNDTKDDIIIPNISLKNGPESFYRLNVDGVAGKEFSNIPIYAQDSLFILIETTISIIDGSIKELLYTDAIQFDKEPFQQSVELVTLAKDAIFLYPKDNSEIESETINLYRDEAGNPIDISGFELKDEELYFTNNKPFVIYGYAIIPDEKELIIEAGARIHFHKNSGIYVKDGAKLIVNGTLSKDSVALEGEVIFEGDRLEPEFAETPGQWGALWITAGSTNNAINHLTIKNGEIGLFVEGLSNDIESTLIIENSQIYNNTRYNLWAKNAKLEASNLVLGGAGSSSLLIENGGNYTFIHSTIANYWNSGFRYNTALEIKNDSQEIGFDLVKADFKNCIIDGNRQNEISLISDNQNSFNFNFLNCFIKYSQNDSSSPLNNLYDFTNSEFFSNIILNGEVDYFLTTKNDFRIGLDSDVIDKGDLDAANYSPLDILGTQRIPAPDLGAFQAIEKE
ncbi:hypothetical protein [Maribacter arcticus]|uniref:hypothetical protein n=1 Tax=Maribacter arcticus TaxID=561365 RepID=UPI0030D7FFAC